LRADFVSLSARNLCFAGGLESEHVGHVIHYFAYGFYGLVLTFSAPPLPRRHGQADDTADSQADAYAAH